MAAKKTAEAVAAEIKPCTCSQFSTEDGKTTGCTKTTLREFAPGHDAKLKTFLIKAGIAGHEVAWTIDGIASNADAETHAAKFKFGYMVAAGIQRAQDKAAEKARKAEERAAKRAEAKAKKNAPKTVKAKVGRWEREGRVEGDEFVYVDKDGNEMRTAKFELIGA